MVLIGVSVGESRWAHKEGSFVRADAENRSHEFVMVALVPLLLCRYVFTGSNDDRVE